MYLYAENEPVLSETFFIYMITYYNAEVKEIEVEREYTVSFYFNINKLRYSLST